MRPSGQRGAGAAGGGARSRLARCAGAACCAMRRHSRRGQAQRDRADAEFSHGMEIAWRCTARLRPGVAGQRLAVGRRRAHHLAGGLARDTPRIGAVAAIARQPAIHRHHFADLQAVALPAGLLQHVRRTHLEAPVADFLRLGVSDVDVDVDMRIGPLHLGDDAGQRSSACWSRTARRRNDAPGDRARHRSCTAAASRRMARRG